MKYKTAALFSLVFLSGWCSFAQQPADTSLHLKEILITAGRHDNFSSGTKIVSVDSFALQRFESANLGDLLMNESSVFIKSYGSGGLALTSFRGGSAGQTAILWNGFNLN